MPKNRVGVRHRDVPPKPHRKGDGFIECGNGQVVTWCMVTCSSRRSQTPTTAAMRAGILRICRSSRKSGNYSHDPP
ncbi:hypothetical protein ACNKHT_09235 [Shigella flexneri]